jgi:hypothetical protein
MHALSAAHTMALQHRPTYFQRTVPAEKGEFALLETAVRENFIPAATGWTGGISDAERTMVSLHASAQRRPRHPRP